MEKVSEVLERGDILDARGRKRSDSWTVNDQPSQTVQSDAHLADIQEILKTFGVTGMVGHLAQVDAQFMDVSEFTDYADMKRHVAGAEIEFMKLPSKVREEFKHDVLNWLDAAHVKEADNEKSIEEVEVPKAPVEPPKDAGETFAPVE